MRLHGGLCFILKCLVSSFSFRFSLHVFVVVFLLSFFSLMCFCFVVDFSKTVEGTLDGYEFIGAKYFWCKLRTKFSHPPHRYFLWP